MKTITQTLSIKEKKAIRRVYKSRIVIFFIFILPILLFGLSILYDVLRSFFNYDYDIPSIVILVFLAVMIYFFGPYFMNLYRDAYRNLRAAQKQVVETRILNKEHRWTHKGDRFFIETQFMLIDTWKNVVLIPDSNFHEMQTGDLIKIHFIPNSKRDILRIEGPLIQK